MSSPPANEPADRRARRDSQVNAPDIDVSAPDSLPHACTRRGAVSESLGLPADVAQSACSGVTQTSSAILDGPMEIGQQFLERLDYLLLQ